MNYIYIMYYTTFLKYFFIGNSFRHVFDSNQEKNAETAIQINGENVELISIIRYKPGFDAFMKFLETELSTESLLFWRAVDRFEDLCVRLDVKKPGVRRPSRNTYIRKNNTPNDDAPKAAPVERVVSPHAGVDRHMLKELATAIMQQYIESTAPYPV